MEKDKYTFTSEQTTHQGVNIKNSVKIEGIDVHRNVLIEEFERFLRGSGYNFNGSLEICKDEE